MIFPITAYNLNGKFYSIIKITDVTTYKTAVTYYNFEMIKTKTRIFNVTIHTNFKFNTCLSMIKILRRFC